MYELKEKDGTILLTGHRLKFYYDEKEKFSEAYGKKLSFKEIRIVFDKLKRHFKLNLWIEFRTMRGGTFKRSWSGSMIYLPYKTSFGMLCHEIAHAIDSKKRGKTKHDKKLMKILGSVIKYCKKKDWWKDEITKRTEIKIKPEPTKIEIRDRKIEKKKLDLKRYNKRLNYFVKLYTNKIKKANRSIVMLERNRKKENIIRPLSLGLRPESV